MIKLTILFPSYTTIRDVMCQSLSGLLYCEAARRNIHIVVNDHSYEYKRYTGISRRGTTTIQIDVTFKSHSDAVLFKLGLPVDEIVSMMVQGGSRISSRSFIWHSSRELIDYSIEKDNKGTIGDILSIEKNSGMMRRKWSENDWKNDLFSRGE